MGPISVELKPMDFALVTEFNTSEVGRLVGINPWKTLNIMFQSMNCNV